MPRKVVPEVLTGGIYPKNKQQTMICVTWDRFLYKYIWMHVWITPAKDTGKIVVR